MFLLFHLYFLKFNVEIDYLWSWLYKRVIPMKGSKPEPTMSFQDRAVQSQALLNVKDSNKVVDMTH
jgi:hypothetical protein